MNLTERTIKALENLNGARTVEILMMKMSVLANEWFKSDSEVDALVEDGKKYINKLAGIDVYIDPYVQHPWVQIYYKTLQSSTNTITIEEKEHT